MEKHVKQEKQNEKKLVLKKPVQYNGKEFTELTFDFDKLCGRDCRAIHRELERHNMFVAAPAFSIEFAMMFAAKACTEKIGYDFFGPLCYADFERIRRRAANFLAVLG